MGLVQQFSAYSAWRQQLGRSLVDLRKWLRDNEIGDAQTDQRLQVLLDRLQEDKLVVAFVAEFSRGKSELINAVFFADYGDRILPSSAGRTTMCPTELLYDPAKPTGIELLPIETRATHASISELKGYADEWQRETFDVQDAETMQAALRRVGEQKRVGQEEAQRLGFTIDPEGEKGLRPGFDKLVEIPRWRHAVINFPHPLLEQGLVILDTPGLNAIGTEPELTLSLLPNAHAVLFILAADTGVTQSDLTVWREHVSAGRGRQKGRLAVLNKIDGLWDGLRPEHEIEREIARQVESVAYTLEIDARNVFPVSAQKGLVAKVNHDLALLARSRIAALEHALAAELLPTKHQIVCESTRSDAEDIVARTAELLDVRLAGLREQLQELTELRGKNQGVIEYIMRKVKVEKDDFDRGLQRYYAVRSVFSQLTNNLYAHLGMDALREAVRSTRAAMLEARFSSGLRDAMGGFFLQLRQKLSGAAGEVDEITRMMEAMYKRFNVEHGMQLTAPAGFSTLRYQKDLDRLEDACNRQLNTLFNLLVTEKRSFTQKFFETVAVQARRTFELANRDIEQWLRTVMSPLEVHVREHQVQLKRRLESVKRIHQATDTLEDRIRELEQVEATLLMQLQELENAKRALTGALESAERGERAAA